MELTKWTKEDLTAHKALDELLSKNASWKTTTAEAIILYRSMVWFAQLRKKIEDSQAEIIKVHQPKEKTEKPERQPGKKATRDARAAEAKS